MLIYKSYLSYLLVWLLLLQFQQLKNLRASYLFLLLLKLFQLCLECFLSSISKIIEENVVQVAWLILIMLRELFQIWHANSYCWQAYWLVSLMTLVLNYCTRVLLLINWKLISQGCLLSNQSYRVRTFWNFLYPWGLWRLKVHLFSLPDFGWSVVCDENIVLVCWEPSLLCGQNNVSGSDDCLHGWGFSFILWPIDVLLYLIIGCMNVVIFFVEAQLHYFDIFLGGS